VKILLVSETSERLEWLTAAIIDGGPAGLEVDTANSVHTAQGQLRAEKYIVVVIDSAEDEFIGLAKRLVPRLTEYGSALDRVVLLDYYHGRPKDGITELSSDNNCSDLVASINISAAASLSPTPRHPLTSATNVVKG
jgi:hypothetical protein